MSAMYILLVTITVLLLTWFVCGYILYKVRINRRMRGVKMLDGELPVIGHALLLPGMKFGTSEQMYDVLEELTDGVFEDRRFWVFNYHFFAAVTLSTIEKVLSSPDAVEKSYIYKAFTTLMNGIFSAPTQTWKKMRKRLNMTFNPRFVSHYIDQMNYQTNIFINLLNNKIDNSNQIKINNVLPLLSQYFFDTVSSTHLGINTKQQGKDRENYAEQVSRMTELVFRRLGKPWLHPDFIFTKCNIYEEIMKVVNDYTPVLANLSAASEEYQKFIDSYTHGISGWKSHSIHTKELLEELTLCKPTQTLVGLTMGDLLVGGSDTSAVASSMILYHLGLHPEYQEIAYKEIMDLYDYDRKTDLNENGKHTPNKAELPKDWEFTKFFPEAYSVWTRNKMDRLEFLNMLIKESVRLTCPPLVVRYLNTDVKCDDFTIPAGTNVGILIKNVHRNPLYYEKPNEFFPFHFSKENIRSRPKMAFIPFSHGPRDCPGKAYGMYAMKCMLAEIIRHFKIVTEPPQRPVEYKLVFMLEHSKGYPIKLIPRNKK